MNDGRLVGLCTRLSARGTANKVLYSFEFFFFLKCPLWSRRSPRPATSGPVAGSRCGCEGQRDSVPLLAGHGFGCRLTSPDSWCSGELVTRAGLRPSLLSPGARRVREVGG